VRRATEEGWNQGNVALFDELAAPDFVNHDPARPNVRTREDYKRGATEVRSAYPDLHFTIEDMIAEGEQVVMRLTFHGTNTGDIVTPMHIPATGKQVTMTEILIVRVASGKVVELWSEADYLGGYQQLGLIPMPQPVG
jgi:predicted ester cyclase